MAKKDFVHLHFHTEYSLLDGACKIKQAVKKAAKHEMPGLAITDHGAMYGAIAFYKACQAQGVNPIIGCEMYMTDNNMNERKKNEDGTQSNHLLLLAENEVGYANLMRLCSAAHLDGFYYKPRIDKEFLAQHSEGLIGTSGCLAAEVPRLIARDEMKLARERVRTYQDILGKENFYMEYQDHGLPEQHKVNAELDKISSELKIPRLVTNDVHYLEQSHSAAHEVMLCLQTRTTMNDPNRLKYGSDQFFMKTQEEMWAEWGTHYADGLNNTVAISERINIDLRLGEDIHFPDYPLPDGHTTETFLREEVKKGIAKRYGIADFNHPKTDFEKTVHTRIEMEISVIRTKGYLNYFVVVQDFVAWSKNEGIPVGPGRGSGAGSIVAYSLDITTVDPLKYGLIFERFLNPERPSPPDFDIDFCQARRGEVIDYVKELYGQENCANIITFGTLGAKTVIRDVGRVLEIPLAECDRLAKLVPEDPGTTIAKAMEKSPDFKKAVQTDPNAKQIMQYAEVLEGLPRNQGTHAAGVVMGEKLLTEIVPVARDKEGQRVTQYEMKTVEMTGLLKMDFLGLKTLTVIAEAVKNIERSTGDVIDPDELPYDNDKSFELLQRGDTVGVFQVESGGMQDMLRKFQPRRFEDIIALIALYRPGPMDILEDYIARHHGKVKVIYDHPLLEGILHETYGYFVYQEQVQQAANVLGGFTLAEGDLLRRAMGKKSAEIMAEQRLEFIAGCTKTNNIPAALSGRIFDNIEKFAGYGFNKSHSAAYSVITMQTAWLKAHYPVEFMAALCSCEMGNPEKLSFFIGECLKMGLEVLPPAVNQSIDRFSPEDGNIRFGLAGIKGVGQGAVESLVEEREKNGPFESMTDFCTRVSNKLANKKCLESLVQCGAFDFTEMDRHRMYSGVEMVMSRALADMRDRLAGQASLFEMLEADADGGDNGDEEIPYIDPWPMRMMLAQEKDLIGFYISGHPLDEFAWDISVYSQATMQDIQDAPPGEVVRTAGLVTGFRKMFTKKTQEPMCAFILEGENASVEVVMFPAAYRLTGHALHNDLPIILAGEIADEDPKKLFGQEAFPLERAYDNYAQQLILRLEEEWIDSTLLLAIKKLCVENRGRVPLRIDVATQQGPTVQVGVETALNVAATNSFVQPLGELVGPENINVVANQNPVLHPPQRSFGKRS